MTSIAFYIDGKLAQATGVGHRDCRLDYLTHGVLIRIDGCTPGNSPIKIAAANAGSLPHRVTIRIRFVL